MQMDALTFHAFSFPPYPPPVLDRQLHRSSRINGQRSLEIMSMQFYSTSQAVVYCKGSRVRWAAC